MSFAFCSLFLLSISLWGARKSELASEKLVDQNCLRERFPANCNSSQNGLHRFNRRGPITRSDSVSNCGLPHWAYARPWSQCGAETFVRSFVASEAEAVT
ncbi:hypothetical protein K438DRAFT_1871278 [Mycena galopus ATCC 62051]|nr:hypothetical protein K438DRAFT_1871278 [Mycena galopus ATCC 62051]